MPKDMTELSGHIWNGDGFEEGTVRIENGVVTEVEYGKMTSSGCCTIMPGLVDGHTHVADAGLRIDRKYTLEELVAPPNGLKHRYLKEISREGLISDMSEYTERLGMNGVSRFLDFREGGVDGCMMLRSASKNAVILGRPVSPEFDVNEMEDILRISDGIGISSISDIDHDYIERIADITHRRGKKLALHVSERIREDIDFVLSLEPDLIIHMVQATKDDVRKCADSDIPIVVCASSNGYFGMTPNIRMMLEQDASVSLGTDNAMLSPSANIFDEFKVFSDILQTQGGSVSDAFECLLKSGCKLLYREFPIEIQPGMDADITIVRSSPEDIPRCENGLDIQHLTPGNRGEEYDIQEHSRSDRRK